MLKYFSFFSWTLNRFFGQSKVLEEVVYDQVVRVLLIKIQYWVLVVFNKLFKLVFVDIVVFRVEVCNLLWWCHLVNFVDRSFNGVQIVKHHLIIAPYSKNSFWMFVPLNFTNARSGRQTFKFAIKVSHEFMLLVAHGTKTNHILISMKIIKPFILNMDCPLVIFRVIHEDRTLRIDCRQRQHISCS